MNKNLSNAKKNKNDEFYTMLVDIEKELIHYKDELKGKTIYCNCDTEESNFVKYFKEHAEEYDIKLLYSSNDFRSDESIELLKRSDVVVTNPPFSLFREYVAQLMEYEKKFLIIGNMNAITYKDIFPLIKNNQLRFGVSISSGGIEFRVPESYPLKAAGSRIDEQGNKYIRISCVRWFTNLIHRKHNHMLPLYAKQSEKNFPKYDNYDAINIDKVVDIPFDYDGVMGVPITFLDKFNPEQFEILGLNDNFNPYSADRRGGYGYIDGHQAYHRLMIRHKLTYDEHGIVIGRKGE